MAQITGKELSGLSDLLTMEQNLMEKYRTYAGETNDARLKDLFLGNAEEHQRHLDELWINLR